MTTTDRNRAKLVAALWDLKQAFARHQVPGFTYLHFNMLLNQPEYREEIIKKARSMDSAELRAIGDRAAQLNIDGELQTRRVVADLPSGHLLQDRDDRRVAWGLLVPARFVLLAAVAVTGWMLARQGPAALPATASVPQARAKAEPLRPTQVVRGVIERNTRWRAGVEYELSGVVYVIRGARLSVEPGAVIRGTPGSALVVTAGASLHARGTADNPIVFTSAVAPGERNPGDWGGLVLLGRAPVNVSDAHMEGLAEAGARSAFGGQSAAWSCGVLEYVRIEFAGHKVYADNELNGLTLGGCGSNTVIDHVQVHRALDDGIEVFGGSVNLKHVLITRAGDDGLDWDLGWNGNVQFLVIQQDLGGDNAVEADNNADSMDAQPRSAPTLYNVSLFGPGEAGGAQHALVLRRGTAGRFHNILMANYALDPLDIRDAHTVQQVRKGALDFSDTALVHVAHDKLMRSLVREQGERDDDGAFDEHAWLQGKASTWASLVEAGVPVDVMSLRRPKFVPEANAPLLQSRTSPPQGEFWDEAAAYVGAFRPGATNRWASGWTAFTER